MELIKCLIPVFFATNAISVFIFLDNFYHLLAKSQHLKHSSSEIQINASKNIHTSASGGV